MPLLSWPIVDILERELWPVYEVTVRGQKLREVKDVVPLDDGGHAIITMEKGPVFRLPQELIERHRLAALAFYEAQAEIQRLLFEQDYG